MLFRILRETKNKKKETKKIKIKIKKKEEQWQFWINFLAFSIKILPHVSTRKLFRFALVSAVRTNYLQMLIYWRDSKKPKIYFNQVLRGTIIKFLLYCAILYLPLNWALQPLFRLSRKADSHKQLRDPKEKTEGRSLLCFIDKLIFVV